MIDKFNIIIFINKYFKYLFDPKILNLSELYVQESDSDSEDEIIDYISE